MQGDPTVLINGKPAARQGDVCTCNGSPDAMATGNATVLTGSEGNLVGGGPYEFEDPEGTVSEAWLRGDGLIRRSRLSEGEGTARVTAVRNAEWLRRRR